MPHRDQEIALLRNQVEMLNSSFSDVVSQGCPKRKVVGIKNV